ncbi:MAG: TatD family hydrolase [Clostridia bacterium]|nr:TatD family hydrolase [Clostridia bacterium]
MEWFDSHCHVNEERFDEDRDEVLARMAENGITRYAVIGSDMETSRHAIAFAAEHRGAVAAGGIHPHEAKGFREEDLEEIRGWYRDGRIRAIGEIGLDFYYDLSPREIQREVCRRQMELAWEIGAPVVYHIRDAHGEMLEIFRSMKGRLTGGIIHCFSGSPEIAKEYLKLGFLISFAGPLTFKKAPKLQEAARLIPRDRLLIETDSPYMAPEPVRGRRNEPANVRYVGMKLAELRGEDPEETAAYTTENAKRVYNL